MTISNIRVGVIGDPVSHSLSPRIHNHWLNEQGINAVYEAIEVKPEDLESFLRAMPEEGFCGVNVTIPHKEAVFKLLESGIPGIITEIHGARHIGAINTIVVSDGRLTGMNTDVYGFIKNLEEKYKDSEIGKISRNTLIIGAGGAARAICTSLEGHLNKNNLTIINRTRKRAEDLAGHITKNFRIQNITVLDWSEMGKAVQNASLLVNTTSLGMKGQPPLDISLDGLPAEAVVADIVYNPLATKLLQQAQERGNPTVDGLGMLLYQALSAYEVWFGKSPRITPKLRQYIAEALK